PTMSNKTSFTADEWKNLTEAPLLAGAGIMKADFGVVSMAKEFAAIIKTIAAAREVYPNNELICSLVADWETNQDNQTPPDQDTLELAAILAKLQAAANLASQKAPAEAAEYKSFLYKVADVAANASGSGFLGTGARVSDAEADYLARLK